MANKDKGKKGNEKKGKDKEKEKEKEKEPTVTSKQEERRAKQALQAERNKRRYQRTPEDDEDTAKLAAQLRTVGLGLVDIVGDGNCLFRALCEQLEGSEQKHALIRKAVVQFLEDNRAEFEFFVEDDVPFDRHVHNMAQLGTYGGNMEIVAFARAHNVDVVVHQSSTPALYISCGANSNKKPLHIAYHSWEHYSSVRPLSLSSSTSSTSSSLSSSSSSSSSSSGKSHVVEGINVEMKLASAATPSWKENMVMQATTVKDIAMIRRLLRENDDDESAVIELLLLANNEGSSVIDGVEHEFFDKSETNQNPSDPLHGSDVADGKMSSTVKEKVKRVTARDRKMEARKRKMERKYGPQAAESAAAAAAARTAIENDDDGSIAKQIEYLAI